MLRSTGLSFRPMRAVALTLALSFSTALPVYAQTLTMGVRGGPESMDPMFSALGTHAEAAKHVFDTLVWSNDTLQLEPSLAESWKPIDETTWEFKLRKGVKFHDGSDFTAEDVKFSIERVPAISGPTTTTIYVRRVKEVKIIDPHTVHIITDGPAATLPYDFVRLFVVSAKAAAGLTKDNAAEAFNSGKAAIGTGPYRFVSWTPKADLVLERFDGYWKGASHWQRVVRREIPNDSTRLAALKAGQVDMINYVGAADYVALQKDPKIRIFKGDSIYNMNLQLDQREKTPFVKGPNGEDIDNPFRNAKVREAFDLAIDRKAMVDVVLEGLGKPANQIMPEGMFGYNAKLPPRAFDPNKARQLLTEAGYPNGFQITLHCSNDRLPGDGAICQGLGQMFSRVGIRTNVQAISRTVYFPAQARKEYSAFMNGWGTLTGEASYTLGSLVHSEDAQARMGAFNRIGYKNPEVDRLMQEGARTLDDTKRRALYEEAMALSMADRTYIPVVILQTVWAGLGDKVVINTRADEDTLAYYIQPAKK